jgi:hypothetical protein
MVDDAMDKRRHAGDMSTQVVHVVLDFVESAWFALRDRDANRDLFARAEIESAVVWVLEPFALALPEGLDDPALGDIVRKMSDRIAAAVVVAAHVLVETEATFDSTMGDVTGREFTNEVIRAIRRRMRT